MENKDYEKEFENKTIMITGGLGFIGSNLAHRLIKLNPKKIIIIDSLIKGLGGDIENIKEIKNNDKIEIPFLDEGGLNINDDRIINYLDDVDYIFNLAGSVSHVDSKNRPLNDLKINLLNHVAFLENCRKFIEKLAVKNEKPKFKILFSATRDIYGKTLTKDLPIREDFIIKEAADPQGIHNHGAEYHHSWYGKTFNFPVIILRLTNTYGPRQKINDPVQGFLGYFIYQALNNNEIELWGGGRSLRDFNYVDDVVDAMLITMASEKTQEVYNLGSFMKKEGRYQELGDNICSVGDAAKRVVNIAEIGKCNEIDYPEDKKAVEPGHVYLDATKIYEDIGWYPKTSFEEGIRKTIGFYKENKRYLENGEIEKQNYENIPFLDLKQQHEYLKEGIGKVIDSVIKKSSFILGEEVKKFEEEFANYCDNKYGIGIANGTDALKLALLALNIGKGDEVIIPVNTAIPTAMAIKDVGAELCFVDVNENYLIDVNKIEDKINEKTKVIMPVHLYGQVCDMNRILEIAKRKGLKVIEDCCQAHGAEYNGRKVPIGDIGCFSFYPSKNLGALGDGGIIITDKEDLKEKLNLLRNYGQKNKYYADIIGVNSRLDEIQAAILRVKLKHLDEFNGKRRKIAEMYDEFLKTIGAVIVPNKDSGNVYHLYVIRTKDRNGLMEYLREKMIGSLIHYPIPLHLQKVFSYLKEEGRFPNAERFAKEIISLPIYPELKKEQIERVCKEIKNYLE